MKQFLADCSVSISELKKNTTASLNETETTSSGHPITLTNIQNQTIF